MTVLCSFCYRLTNSLSATSISSLDSTKTKDQSRKSNSKISKNTKTIKSKASTTKPDAGYSKYPKPNGVGTKSIKSKSNKKC